MKIERVLIALILLFVLCSATMQAQEDLKSMNQQELDELIRSIDQDIMRLTGSEKDMYDYARAAALREKENRKTGEFNRQVEQENNQIEEMKLEAIKLEAELKAIEQGGGGFSANIPGSGHTWRVGNYGPALFTFEGSSFSLSYEVPSSENDPYARLIAGSGLLEEVVTELEGMFDLPSQIEIILTSDKPGPLYYDHKIHITYEFLRHVNEVIYATYEMTDTERGQFILDMAEFVLYHEVGHAILDIMGLDELKYDEDAVDEFSAVLSSVIDNEDIIYEAAIFFESNAEYMSEESVSNVFGARHAVDEDRMYHILCLLYGSNPEENEDIIIDFEFSGADEINCSNLYQEAYEYWGNLLAHLLKD
jgi:hypothetical protein